MLGQYFIMPLLLTAMVSVFEYNNSSLAYKAPLKVENNF